MKNKKEILGLAVNISLVVFLFCFIVAGLNIIGIYSLPKPIEKLLGTYVDEETSYADDDIIYSSIDFTETASVFQTVSLDYESAFTVLNNLVPRRSYAQKINVIYKNDQNERKEIINVMKTGSAVLAEVSDENGIPFKRVEYDNDRVLISEFFGDFTGSNEFSKGEFNIYEDCGFILTAEEFLNSGFELQEADFNRFIKDGAYYISISFDNKRFNSSQFVKFVISLDFGVVTEAYCYENDSLVYEMTTESISEA